jgi:hypothetical protein
MMISTSVTTQTSTFSYAETTITGDKISNWLVFYDTDFNTFTASVAVADDTVLWEVAFVVSEESLFRLTTVLTIPDFVGLNIKKNYV